MLVVLLEHFFDWYAHLLGRHVRLFLTIPVIISLFLTVGWVRFDVFSDPRQMFTPETSFWKQQEQRLWDYYGAKVDGIVFVVYYSKTGANLLTSDGAKQVLGAVDYVERNITLGDDDLELDQLLDTNAPQYELNQLVRGLLRLTAEGDSSFSPILTYPVADVFHQKFFVPLAFGNVLASNGTAQSADSLLLCYMFKYENATDEAMLLQFQHRLHEYSRTSEGDVKLVVFSWKSLMYEMRENTYLTLKYTPGTLSLIMLFAVVVSFSWKTSKSLHWHAIAGLLSVIIAYFASMGLMYGLGFQYNDLVAVTSFLALAIGIDDTFIMLAGWRRHAHITDPRYTQKALKQTLGAVLLATFVIILLFLPVNDCRSLCVMLLIATSFVAINANVIGFLSWWKVDIDIVSMVTILMSVGFSVDYTVHMAFTYSRQSIEEFPSSVDRVSTENVLTNNPFCLKVQATLDQVARPIILSAGSTLTSVCLLMFIGSYIIRTFLKTIILVVLFGVLHSLFILPMLLIILDGRRRRLAKNFHSDDSSPSILLKSRTKNDSR